MSQTLDLFVPGRLCLIGEHSDWAGTYRRFNSSIEKGYALVSGTTQGAYAHVRKNADKLVLHTTLNDGTRDSFECPMEAEALRQVAEAGGFWSYACGVAHEIVTKYHVRGLEIDNYKTDLPIKKGLSSSAAICVLVARAFNRMYDLKLTVAGEMDIAYHGEVLTPSRCGRLDQCCAYGSAVVLVTFDGDRIETREIRVSEEVYMVLVDLHAGKDTRLILSALNHCYPFAENEISTGVQKLLGPINKDFVHRCVCVLESGGEQAAAQLGRLMTDFQAEFDRYAQPACPQELTAPVLHRLLTCPDIQPWIYGGKGVGSQGDGTAQLVCRDRPSQDKLIEYLTTINMSGLKLTLGSVLKVRKAVLPIAGYCHRMFPATRVIPPALFPVCDPSDQIVKPAILIIVEEMLRAGIEEVIIVCQEHDLANLRELFHVMMPIENYNTLSLRHKKYAEKLLELGKHVRLVVQSSQEGFGHAVWSAREAVGNEPFLLSLGDHVYGSKHPQQLSCTQQVLDAFTRYGCNMLSLEWVDEETLSQVGVATGIWHGEAALDVNQSPEESKEIVPDPSAASSRLLNVTALTEKPSLEIARQYFAPPVTANQSDSCKYLGFMGQYVLHPQVFTKLQASIDNNQRVAGLIELTPVLDALRAESRFVGVLVQGQRFDLGQPQGYAAVQQMASS
eukprot:TRINITY_DN11209_c0_g3_i2.p1 TRINITY_DN11209_c0_g3~~TRINITY_DN11209_c0_g3_i2.p1  ORF type:complete len:675 (+),score=159.04 TRINITY_DN11209_c0_g3_i2:88-2112(+)